MPDTVEVPSRPALVTIPNVELIKTGTWEISTGTWTVSERDLRDAVAATDAPGVRRPVLKLGHVDPRFDGEPAVGWVDNLRVDDNGTTLYGDYVGVPAWLADVIASAYPDRSIEGVYGYKDQSGHVHNFVLEAVALLGVTAPGVGTLASLQDVAKLYGVAASSENDTERFAMPVSASGAPIPREVTVAGSVTVENVRRSFYDEGGPAASNWWWIEELFVDPPEVIAVDDDTGSLFRVPFSVNGNEIVWGESQAVRREYVAASATLRNPVYTFASRDESRTIDTEEVEGGAMPNLNDEFRKRLGVADDADDATILAALDEALNERAEAETAEPVAASRLPEGIVTIEASVLDELRRNAQLGADARADQERERRESLVSAAISDGRIAPARRDHWLSALEADSGAADVLASLTPGLVPVDGERGHNKPAVDLDDDDAVLASLFPDMNRKDS